MPDGIYTVVGEMFHHMESSRDSPITILTIHHKGGKDSQPIEIIQIIAKESLLKFTEFFENKMRSCI